MTIHYVQRAPGSTSISSGRVLLVLN